MSLLLSPVSRVNGLRSEAFYELYFPHMMTLLADLFTDIAGAPLRNDLTVWQSVCKVHVVRVLGELSRKV